MDGVRTDEKVSHCCLYIFRETTKKVAGIDPIESFLGFNADTFNSNGWNSRIH